MSRSDVNKPVGPRLAQSQELMITHRSHRCIPTRCLPLSWKDVITLRFAGLFISVISVSRVGRVLRWAWSRRDCVRVSAAPPLYTGEGGFTVGAEADAGAGAARVVMQCTPEPRLETETPAHARAPSSHCGFGTERCVSPLIVWLSTHKLVNAITQCRCPSNT